MDEEWAKDDPLHSVRIHTLFLTNRNGLGGRLRALSDLVVFISDSSSGFRLNDL